MQFQNTITAIDKFVEWALINVDIHAMSNTMSAISIQKKEVKDKLEEVKKLQEKINALMDEAKKQPKDDSKKNNNNNKTGRNNGNYWNKGYSNRNNDSSQTNSYYPLYSPPGYVCLPVPLDMSQQQQFFPTTMPSYPATGYGYPLLPPVAPQKNPQNLQTLQTLYGCPYWYQPRPPYQQLQLPQQEAQPPAQDQQLPNKEVQQPQNKSTYTCYSCSAPGHTSTTCNICIKGVVCNNCSKPRHLAKVCCGPTKN